MTTETLRRWIRQAERDAGRRPGLTRSGARRRKALEREVEDPRHADELLRTASADFAEAERELRRR